MKISACVITKNEEHNLPACLESIKSVVFEMIVVDTGSTDATVEVAKSYGAKVFHFEWVDDFSKAKNFAISKAKGDWIIFLDADEYITNDSIPYLRAAIAEAVAKRLDMIICSLLNYDKQKKKVEITTPHIRIFKNDPKIQYKGAIHERIIRTDRPADALDVGTDIKIIHTGYSEDEIKKKNKSKRNLELLYKELEKKPRSSDLCFYLSESLMLDKDYEKALDYAYKMFEYNNSELRGVYEKNYINIFNCMMELRYPKRKLEQTMHEAIQKFPSYPDFYLYLGDHYKREHQYMDAIEAYKTGLSYVENVKKTQSGAQSTLLKVLDTIGYLYAKTEQWHKCVETHVEVLKIDRYFYSSLVNLMTIFAKFESISNTVGFFQKIYDYTNKKDALILLKASIEIKNVQLADFFFNVLPYERQQIRQEYAHYELLAGNYERAASVLFEIYEESNSEENAIKLIIAILLSKNGNLARGVLHKLPPSLQLLTKKVVGIESSLLPIDKSEFLKVIYAIIQLAKPEEITNFLDEIVQENLLVEVADLLYYHEKYQLAFVFYNQYLEKMPQLSDQAVADLSIKVSDCLYHDNKLDMAMLFVQNAQKHNPLDYRSYPLSISIGLKTGNHQHVRDIALLGKQNFPNSKYFDSVLHGLGLPFTQSDY